MDILRIAPGECLCSIERLLERCIIAGVAARLMVVDQFLAGGQSDKDFTERLQVQSKGMLSHKEAVEDLVTAADVAAQELITTALSHRRLRGGLTRPCEGKKFAFALIGEEHIDNNIDANFERFERYVRMAENTASVQASRRLLAQQASQTITNEDAEIAVFVDPIDATVAFVNGNQQAPMTLIGIALNGIAIAGVVSRLFSPDNDSEALSWAVLGGPCFLWGRPLQSSATQHPADVAANLVFNEGSTIRVTHSQGTNTAVQRAALQALEPTTFFPAVGGGNKLMMVVQQAATCSWVPERTAAAPNVDAFISTAGLSMWDVCAPHALLKWFGGNVNIIRQTGQQLRSEELRYDTDRRAAAVIKDKQILVAATSAALPTVTTRLSTRAGIFSATS